jgi:hypothetical protein
MVKYILVLFISLMGYSGFAQDTDSLKAFRKDGNWAMKYVMKSGESVRMLALRFCVAEADIIKANEPETIKKLAPGVTITIPVTHENYFSNRQPLTYQRELYYEVGAKDDIALLSTYSGVTKSQMRTWNGLKGNTIIPGQILMVGWLKMIPRDTANPATLIAYPSARKKVKADTNKAISMPVPGGLDTVYANQTSNGINVLTEKGTVVFFDRAGKGSVYLAFHNTARRGAIIKVYNPGSKRTIYCRVLGPMPDTKVYSGCIIGISNSAKEALGVNDNKAWCELSYSPN